MVIIFKYARTPTAVCAETHRDCSPVLAIHAALEAGSLVLNNGNLKDPAMQVALSLLRTLAESLLTHLRMSHGDRMSVGCPTRA
jgi:hypothetical protein